ncbi:hypothetical protein EDD16DRAFT_1896342 [Pisolithus croceorrhizus]|nr:hypothetical protein EDD16DRAFT_1896342 [Pisolithus croceorrhizus]KAI6130213.1 hypothetical protein EV401DRAFT_2066301 [Pisolithus croceorrhizus]KAI6164508.1 hypothetical protein EDD17DRAFT_352272 [Pisolithus thermaeus]
MSDHFDAQKRSPNNKVHRGLAARFSPTASFGPESSSAAPTDSHSTASASALAVTPTTTAVAQDPNQNSPSSVQSSSTSAHGNTSTASTTATSVSAVSSTTSSATTSALSTSAAPAVVTVHSTGLGNSPSTTASLWASNIGSASTPTTTASATSTSTSSSGSVNVTAVVGGVAGTLAGLAVLGFLIMWLMRRRKEKYDDDDFNASIFRRQSAVLVDDPPAPNYNPRPPTMIERHVNSASPALAAQRNFSGPGPNFFGGYGQQSLAPGDVVQPAYGQPVMGYGEPGQLARQPSNAAFLTRQPSAAAGYGNSAQLARQPSNVIALNRQPSAGGYGATPGNNDAHYVDLDRSSVTPFQAAQYAAISRHLKDMDPHLPRTSDDLNRAPLPSPFDDQPQATAQASTPAAVPRPPSPVHLGSGADAAVHASGGLAPRTLGVTTDANRPVSAYTVYEEGDAYGGI